MIFNNDSLQKFLAGGNKETDGFGGAFFLARATVIICILLSPLVMQAALQKKPMGKNIQTCMFAGGRVDPGSSAKHTQYLETHDSLTPYILIYCFHAPCSGHMQVAPLPIFIL